MNDLFDRFEKLGDAAQVYASLNNMRENMDMESIAKAILLEENYIKFMKSYKFTFWFQLLGILAGFIVPSVVLYVIFKDIIFIAFGVAIGIFWMIIWFIISMLIPPTKIYRKFAKWYRKKDASLDELDVIFYKNR